MSCEGQTKHICGLHRDQTISGSVEWWGQNPVRPLYSFTGGSAGKKHPANVGDPGLIPGSGRSSGEGYGFPL